MKRPDRNTLFSNVRIALGDYKVGDLIDASTALFVCAASHPAGWRDWHCRLHPGHVGRHANWAWVDVGQELVRRAFGHRPTRVRVRAVWRDQ